jgi:hypothetical protein
MARATLTIEVEFDGNKADAEGVAGALDMIIKTGLESVQKELNAEYGVTEITPALVLSETDYPSALKAWAEKRLKS